MDPNYINSNHMNVDSADMKLPESVDSVGTVAGLPKAIGYNLDLIWKG